MKTVEIVEYVQHPPGRVDLDAGVIYGAKVLGWESANGRRYKPEGVNPKLYEGLKVRANHPRKPGDVRQIQDTLGRIEGAEKKPDGIFGNVRFVDPGEPTSRKILLAAKHMPELFGLSHSAVATESRANGKAVIESVNKVHGADYVDDPATVKGIFESRETTMTTPIKHILDRAFNKTTIKKVFEDIANQKLCGMKGPEDGGLAMEMPAEPELSSDDQALEALVGLIKAAVQDKDWGKAADVLKMFKKLMGDSGGESEKPAEEKPDEKAAESKKKTPPPAGQAELEERFNLRLRSRDLCAEQGIVPNRILRIALDHAADEAEIVALIDEHKATVLESAGDALATSNGHAKPKAKPPSSTKTIAETKAPLSDPKALAKWLRE